MTNAEGVVTRFHKGEESSVNDLDSQHGNVVGIKKIKTWIDKLNKGPMEIPDDIVFPPNFSYLPSPELLTFMINRATKAKKDANGNYGFIF